MTYQRVLVKQSAKRSLKGTKPKRRALGYLLLSLFLALLAALPHLGIQFFSGTAERSGNVPAYWSCWLFALVLPIVAQALLCAGGCAYCLDLWRGRGVEGRRFFFGFTCLPRVSALGLLIALFSFLWALPCLSLVWFFAIPFSLFPLAPLPPDALAFLSELAQPTPWKIALFCILAVLFLALYIGRTLRYSMAYFVLLDQPSLTAAECLKESKALMKGRRWKLVVLMLSFLGWPLLEGLLVTGVQLLWPVLLSLFPVSLLPGAAFWCLRILLILYLAAMAIAILLLPLWLMNYVGGSLAGFYDYAQADRRNRPTPPRSWQVYG